MRAALATLLLSTSICAYGQGAYHPEAQVSGTIRSWGSAQMAELMALWERGFQRYHPAVRFEDKLNGTVSGMGGLYSGATDLALMGREIWPTEAMAYEQTTGHSATGVQVAIGSFDVPTKADALVVFVHRNNPIIALSFAQLRAIFGCGDEGKATIQRWGELGVTGAFADKAIHVYGYKRDNAAAKFFKSAVLKDLEWRCEIKTYANQASNKSRRIDSGQLILDALKSDPYGVAISNPHYAGPEVKAVALALGGGAPPIPATREAVASGAYPLARAIYIFFNHDPGRPPDPRVREFLRYVLSAEGQQDVIREGAYLPLPESVRQAQLREIP
jgi:phosphate transport system substrate-binding protein